MLQAKKLKKIYVMKYKEKPFGLKKKKQIEAVHQVNMEIGKGEIVGLLGVNGAGKTTTIKMLTAMIAPSEGEIFIDGIDAVKDPMSAKQRVNIITGGERNIYWRLTAKENLQYFGRLYGIKEKKLDDRINEVLKVVDLINEKDVPVERFSKGMKQRLQIARGLINDPDYLFLDEPTLGLDVIIAKEVRKYIKKLAIENGKGILLTTHYISEAEQLCDYIYIINQGNIVASGDMVNLRKRYFVENNVEFEVESLNDKLISNLKSYAEIEKKDIEINRNIIKVISKKDISVDITSIINESDCHLKRYTYIDATLEDILVKILGDTNEKMD